ncbi:hypothetical protein MGN70_008021 [Eutypa lata]|nr:hypothetical protein MGN70_008021 [Eutypa lata]
MPSSQPLLLVADIAARGLGCMMIYSNYLWHSDPAKTAKVFGLANPTPREAELGRGLGGRNAAVGLAVLALSLTEQRRAVSILFASWTIVGLTDIAICLRPSGNRNVTHHIVGTSICAAVGLGHWLLLR